MSVKITGLGKLQKELEQARRAFKNLDGQLGSLVLEANEPASVQAAINKMEAMIDSEVASYRGSRIVTGIASEMKEKYREMIIQAAAQHRPTTPERELTDESLPEALRQIENVVQDIRWADMQSFERHIKKLSRLLHATDLEPITQEATEGVDLEAWISQGQATQRSMMGSAQLTWPEEHRKEIGVVALLIDHFADNPEEAIQFSHQFFYSGRKVSDALQSFSAQVLVPFARDYIDFAKQRTGVVEATRRPERTEPAARKVFVVHGHDEGAREAVARFLERLDFETIILHEQANQGRTIIEKIEAHGDVGFAVVLLTPDDVGGLKDGELSPRARQNVLLELGFFIGALGRSRVCALKRGDVEIPSDFGGVVYEPYDAGGGAWKSALGRELQAAGFEIDWNKVMGR